MLDLDNSPGGGTAAKTREETKEAVGMRRNRVYLKGRKVTLSVPTHEEVCKQCISFTFKN